MAAFYGTLQLNYSKGQAKMLFRTLLQLQENALECFSHHKVKRKERIVSINLEYLGVYTSCLTEISSSFMSSRPNTQETTDRYWEALSDIGWKYFSLFCLEKVIFKSECSGKKKDIYGAKETL